jgi:glycine cleavage system T protein
MGSSKHNIIIIGAGIVGTSIAYHLALAGERDIMVLDKGKIFDNDGSSSHAPGILGLATASPTLTGWARYSARLYKELGCFFNVGGMDIALTEATERELHRRHGLALARGLPARYIDADEREAMFPQISPEARAALFHPQDGITHAPTVARTMADAVRPAVTFRQQTAVAALLTGQGRITGVQTAKGETLAANRVVLATNIWGAVLAQQVGITLPMLAAEHQYVVTAPLDALAGKSAELRMPNLRFFDYGVYVRQHGRSYGFGSYFHPARMVAAQDLGKTAINEFRPADFKQVWKHMQRYLPACQGADFIKAFNGMFGFTVDDQPILGETPQVAGLWLALGAWVTHAGGVGRTLARWMTTGTPDCDIHAVSANRFHAHQRTPNYIQQRSAAHYNQHLQIVHPREPWGEPREMRLSPYHQRLVDLGAVFDEFAGWEMAQWYDGNARLLEQYAAKIPPRDPWGGRHWSPICAVEHLATRAAAGLFNINGLTRIEVTGPKSLEFLARICANRVDVALGKVVYSTLLNAEGHIVADLVVVRRAADRFLLITSTLHGQHDLAWLRHHNDEKVSIEDISAQWTGVALWGPKARDILQPLTQASLENSAFPFYTAQEVEIAGIPVLALRLSFVGELGWELHAADDQGLALWDAVWQAGQTHGLVACGSVALDSLSKEKGYVIYGHDINGDHTPYEAGFGWAVRTIGRAFIGREALLTQKATGIKRRRGTLAFDPGGFALGGEPVLLDGVCIGFITSANGGYNVGHHIAYAYLPVEHAAPGTRLAVEYLGQRHAVSVIEHSPYDRGNQTLRS